MNWKLIFNLSLFGFVMAIATVWWIPTNIEPLFWLAIFLYVAYRVAKKAPGKYFGHGFMISIFNCLWITAAHYGFYDAYAANHADEIDGYTKMGGMFAENPRAAMLVVGPVIGIVCGLILGLFSFIASKFVKK
jgi:uncharacterized membrane protein